jgi:Arc/MetJ-type ribon-helix-helix transcriptional regulator
MATTKLTITLDDRQLESVRRVVASGKASSVSGFVKHAVEIALSDVAGWQAMLDEALQQTGGALTKKETDWADRVLGARTAKDVRRRKRA